MPRIQVKAGLRWTGNYRWVKQIIDRAEPSQIERQYLGPWSQWVRKVRVPLMYQHGGRVPGPGGQEAWKGLSRWTKAQKGPGGTKVMISSKGMGFGTMAASYDISTRRSSQGNWRLEMVSRIRSRSRYSPGFDYPSALHEGTGIAAGHGPIVIRPRADGPGVLAIPLKGSIVGGEFKIGRWTRVKTGETRRVLTAAGRRHLDTYGQGMFNEAIRRKMTRGLVRSRAQTISTFEQGMLFRMETHPRGAPPRPHIRFFGIDMVELAERVVSGVVEGTITPPTAGRRVA